MKKSTRVLGAASLLFASMAAHAVDDTYLFESVGSVEHSSVPTFATSITGVLVNESTPTSVSVPASEGVVGDRCAKYYDVMLKEPGTFTLSITVRTTTITTPPTTTVQLLKCSLARNP